MNLQQAQTLAEQVCDLLRPACEQIVVAGSIRRECGCVNDIEILALPCWDRDPLTHPKPTHCRLDRVLLEAEQAGRFAYDQDVKRNGTRHKRLIVPSGCGDVYSSAGHCDRVPVDLFLTDAANFGNMLTIRTGNKEFSKACVTRFGPLALMPKCFQHDKGYLWRVTPGKPNQRVCCPTEEEFFRLLGLPAVPPCERTLGKVMQLKARKP